MDKRRLKEDFSWVRGDEKILSVLLFGSRATGEGHERSDIDIALVAPGISSFYYDCEGVGEEDVSGKDVLMKVFSEIDTSSRGYDVHIFEELPLHIQMDIIENHEVIVTSDELGMYEYFFNYRKLWDDQKHRNVMSKEELLAGL